MSVQQPTQPHVSFAEACWFWLKLGFISFGGPAGQIAIMHNELVDKRGWISERRFLHALNYCMVLPGPEAQQLATYLGWLMHRTWGGIVAGGLFVLPSLFLLILLSWIYVRFGEVTAVAGAFYGIKPAVTAIVLQAAHRIGTRALKNSWLWGIACLAFVAIFALQIPFPLIVACAALIGFVGNRMAPRYFQVSGGHGSTDAASPADTVQPPHTLFRASKLICTLITGFILWALPMLYLTFKYGWTHTLTQLGWFFTKAALLTFGGAYAVLPYVYQGATVQFEWLTPAQMMDGLALGETTPGPLIMVVTYVGFLAGYFKSVLGADFQLIGAILSACLVTWVTFLPSFIFIFAGAPFIESSQHSLKISAPLTAVTAAVVGVIVNLALFFAYHTLWPQGFSQSIDLASLAIAIAAAVALFRFKQNVIYVIAASAVVGLVLKTVI